MGRQASVTGNTANSETPAQGFARAFRSILVRSFDGNGICVVMASSVSLMVGKGDGDVVCGGANARELGFARVILWSLACSRGLNGACWYTSEYAEFFNPSYRRT